MSDWNSSKLFSSGSMYTSPRSPWAQVKVPGGPSDAVGILEQRVVRDDEIRTPSGKRRWPGEPRSRRETASCRPRITSFGVVAPTRHGSSIDGAPRRRTSAPGCGAAASVAEGGLVGSDVAPVTAVGASPPGQIDRSSEPALVVGWAAGAAPAVEREAVRQRPVDRRRAPGCAQGPEVRNDRRAAAVASDGSGRDGAHAAAGVVADQVVAERGEATGPPTSMSLPATIVLSSVALARLYRPPPSLAVTVLLASTSAAPSAL